MTTRIRAPSIPSLPREKRRGYHCDYFFTSGSVPCGALLGSRATTAVFSNSFTNLLYICHLFTKELEESLFHSPFYGRPKSKRDKKQHDYVDVTAGNNGEREQSQGEQC